MDTIPRKATQRVEMSSHRRPTGRPLPWGLLTFPSVFIPNGPIACPSTSTCYAVGNDSDPSQIYLLGDDRLRDLRGLKRASRLRRRVSLGVLSPAPSATTCYVSAMNLAGKDKVMMYATTNSGNSWVSQAMPRLTGPPAAIACLSDSVCYGAGSSSISPLDGEAQIVDTTDSGATWNRQTLPTGTAFLSAAVCPSSAMCFVQGSTTGTRAQWFWQVTFSTSRLLPCRWLDRPTLFDNIGGNRRDPSLPLEDSVRVLASSGFETQWKDRHDLWEADR